MSIHSYINITAHHTIVKGKGLEFYPIPPYFKYMNAFRPLRTALCVYEGLRLAFLVGAFLLLQPEGAVAFPWLALISPGALFLLMALFWRLSLSDYRAYCPLYLAGKGLSVIGTVFWLFFAQSSMIREMLLHDTAMFVAQGVVVFLVLGDILSAWLAAIMIRGDR